MNQSDYQTCEAAIAAIPKEDVQIPSIPLDVYLQEAEDLAIWCISDQAQLLSIGINENASDELKVRTGACREAQSIWNRDRRMIKDKQREWKENAPLAFELRDELLHAYKYAFREREDLLGRVDEIGDGSSKEDMIQDLNDLSVLGKDNTDLLEGISFDLAKLDTAANLSDEMATLLAEANGVSNEGNESKVIRDQAYTYLKEFVDKVRDAGRYLFWKNEDRLVGYQSEYRKRLSQKSYNKKKTETTTIEE